jgi:dissimilatory sulfite reductase (desulfoviridin) alpha/beta subunit
MQWTQEAENAVKKVPFFVRKKVRTRVESQVAAANKSVVTLADVKTAQQRYLQSMSAEIKGYQIDSCFGPSGCPNRTVHTENLLEKIEHLLASADLLAFLKQQVKGNLKFHHEFRISLAECPNACSQPQIKDIGIIGAVVPEITTHPCSLCGDCEETCPDHAIVLNLEHEKPEIDMQACMSCGKCIAVCPTGTIGEQKRGFRVQLGGKLGRHPQLARELPGIHSEKQVLDIINTCIKFYKQTSRGGKRFAQIFGPTDFDDLLNRLSV